jgi:transcriptional regulator with XRE-family HTH domain
MQTRIRELRKLRSLTLKQLADKVGTTPQTIQRLETANMTVSTIWLDRIAKALLVEPADLLTTGGAKDIPFLGRIGPNGAVYRSGQENPAFSVEVPAHDPVAVRLDHRTGRFDGGSILIATRLQPQELTGANGADCLVAFKRSAVALRRIYLTPAGTFLFAPLDPGPSAEFDASFEWIARIVMSVKYY